MTLANVTAPKLPQRDIKSRKSPAERSRRVPHPTAEQIAAVKMIHNWLNDRASENRNDPALASSLRTLGLQMRNFINSRGAPRENLRRAIRRTLKQLTESLGGRREGKRQSCHGDGAMKP